MQAQALIAILWTLAQDPWVWAWLAIGAIGLMTIPVLIVRVLAK